MAVQTHQPSNEQCMKPPGVGALDDSPMFLSNVRASCENITRKRGSQVFLMQSQQSTPRPQKMMRLDQQRHHQHQPAMVSTGLQLAFGEQNSCHDASKINHLLSSSSTFGEDFGGSVVGRFGTELDQLLQAQGEQLRGAIAERQQAHCKQLLRAAEKSATQILKNKQTELDRLVRRSAELEKQLTRLQSESFAWQSKAAASQATASSLHAQIQHVMAAAPAAALASGPAEDAGSACVDPDRPGQDGKPMCRACRGRAVSVVVLPCRHLCLCEGCDLAGAAKICPVCDRVGSGSVRVFLC